MSELINKIKCPMGCSSSTFSESTKTINESKDSLLLEGNNSSSKTVKSYTCHCCGNTFDMTKKSDKTVL